jgi:uncharacterized protein YfdQ (DUF2303 family)
MKTDITALPDDAIASVAELVRCAQTADSIAPGCKPYLLIDHSQKVEIVENLLARPIRKLGHPVFCRAESFSRYVNEHKTDSSRIYLTGTTSMVAVLDHHGEEAAWGQHRATYNMKHSLEWQTWVVKSGQKMGQKEFCEFIEDNAKDIVGRTDMVELIRTLQVNANVDYKSFERGDNGNCSLMFVKTVASRAGEKGEVELPPVFTILIPAFEGSETSAIDAKLRFDLSDAKLKLWYELKDLQRILNAHTDAAVASVAQATGINIFYGTP